MYRFAAASKQEIIVFGSAKPEFANEKVSDWIGYMQRQKIERVCCLLPKKQLAPYANLLGNYEQKFGHQKVCWTPIDDFTIPHPDALTGKILPFLLEADKHSEKVVVHCSGGVGRTGLVLAAWLVYGRGFSNKTAIAAVNQTGRNSYEAAIAAVFQAKNPLKVVADIDLLLTTIAHLSTFN
ncbi:protein-tyrosine phosphatase family protein [Chlorogloea sp. CCALA 695]|uniref:protein-tyrosine phosphatase family protein n=1 Tax=Chlorogloea sp. CCALA 695 TaxID=2107693 RepID=UPI000D07E014|nr:dual specificity protein phosphatase family protein [Chlorogloea sp. CCALA 695]PSB29214.1 protein phosphatase [Chlorogloea sp. CCALA 695]